MNHKERMLAAIRKEAVDRIPWAPRMDLWYIAHKARGTLPQEFENLDMAGIADKFNMACHAVGADYTLYRNPEEHFPLTGFVLDTHPDYPYRLELEGLPMEFSSDGENFTTIITTPAGEITTHAVLNQEMKENGISYPFVKSHPIKSPDDFEAVAQIFEHIKVIPTPQGYKQFQNRIGDKGLAVGLGLISASPMHIILHGLMPMEMFFRAWGQHRDKLKKLASRIEPFFESVLSAVLQCDAEVVFWGANYDQNTTWPPFFKEEIAPWLARVSKRLREKGKLLLTHTDGENKALLPLYPSCGIDVAESVCPAPMTRCTLKEIRTGMGKETAIWGGIPSIVLLDAHMKEDEFDTYLAGLFREMDSGRGLILGVSDNVPPEVNLTRMEKIKSEIDRFGPVQSR
ncbi:MAG: uroporphyrinogen decarboxylase family protein [Desulfobacterales bacterium]|nr:uroporphyrinogen decarboxylase family protein [Desulfobacterales bacterium]